MATTDNDAFKTVFNDRMWDACAHYVVNTTVPGVVEITERWQLNSLWLAGVDVGYGLTSDGVILAPVEGVVLALSSNPNKMHHFQRDTANLVTAKCTKCGETVVACADDRLVRPPKYRV